jgi:hypothetical protein
MKSTDDVKTFFAKATLNTDRSQDRIILAEALAAGGLKARPGPLSGKTNIWRFTMRSRITKIALAAVVVLAAVIGIPMLAGSRPAFADVVRPILTARTAVYTIVATLPDKPAFTVHGEFMQPGLTRQTIGAEEGPDKEMIYIVDHVQGRSLVLVPSQKTAVVMELKNATDRLDPRAVNMFAELRRRILLASEHGDESVAYVGEARIDGRRVFGYRLVEAGVRTTLWADATSFLPLRIECAMADEPADQPADMVMTDIQFDVPLDPAAFRLAVPPGYHEQTMQMDGSPVTEADVIILLRFYAEATQGRFPSTLDMSGAKELARAFKKTIPEGEPPNLAEPTGREAFQRVMQDMMKMLRGLKFVVTLPPEADWHYAPGEAVFGDATKPIFWYRPSGSATYRVIYADLSVRDVAPADLPR